jgi:hypothetical protein
MRRKCILRAGTIGHDPDAWILGIYFTGPTGRQKAGTITIGGPKRFEDEMHAVLQKYFGLIRGQNGCRFSERRREVHRRRRKRLVFDVRPVTKRHFDAGIEEMRDAGIFIEEVERMGRLLR